MLGEQKVKFDPTKGSWKQHEYISMKLLYAIRHARMEFFMKLYGNDIIHGGVSCGASVEVVLWQLQESLDKFAVVTERAADEVTRFVALTAKYLESWLECRDSVKVGDPIFIDVEGCDWIPFWAASGKTNI